jgi:hypothetical protein
MTDKAEQELEAKLQNLGLTSAPRVTPAMIDAMIERTEYIMLPGDNHMICKLYLFGGRFTITGESSTVSKENFDPKIGEEISLRSARDKLWPLAGAILAYDLQHHRTPLPPEVLALPEDVQLVVVELNQVMSRLKALGPLVANEQELLAGGVAQEEVGLLKEQFTFMSGYSETLQKRLARIGL